MFLEEEFETELEDARVVSAAWVKEVWWRRNWGRRRSCRLRVASGAAVYAGPLSMVEDVEAFGAEFEGSGFGDRKRLKRPMSQLVREGLFRMLRPESPKVKPVALQMRRG